MTVLESFSFVDTPLVPADEPPNVQRIVNNGVSYDMPRPNLLRNGGFENWSRGPGPFSQLDQETADGWVIYPNRHDETAIIDQVVSTAPAGSTSAARIRGTTINANIIAQTIDPQVVSLNGVTVSLSFLALAPQGAQFNAIVGIVGKVGFVLPQPVLGTGDWQIVRMTAHIPAGVPEPVLVCVGGYGMYDFVFDNVSLVVGTTPSNYQPTLAAPGLPGDPGPAGPSGPTGPQGAQGPAGPAGLIIVGSADGVTSGPSTQSAVYGDIPEMTASVNPTATCKLLAWLSMTVSQSTLSNDINIAMRLDGTPEQGAVTTRVPSTNGRTAVTIFATWNNVAPGAHTIKGRWSTTGGTLTAIATLRHLLVEQAG